MRETADLERVQRLLDDSSQSAREWQGRAVYLRLVASALFIYAAL
jgi:hypothetical protein